MRQAALLLFCAVPLMAGEYAVLDNGFRIRANRHETHGSTTVLYTPQGTLEFATAAITNYDPEEALPEPPKAEPAPVAAQIIAPAPIDPIVSIEQMLKEAAERHGLKPEFVLSVAAAESGLNPKAISKKGAIGLMQLMPGTAAELGVDPTDPKQNADAGVRYLKDLLVKYSNHPDYVRLALAAYNAGPGAVDKYRSVPPYRETVNYVEYIVRKYVSKLNQ